MATTQPDPSAGHTPDDLQYGAIFAAAPCGILLASGGRIALANPAAARLLGAHDAAALTDVPLRQIFGEEADALAQAAGGAGAGGGEHAGAQLAARGLDGRALLLAVSVLRVPWGAERGGGLHLTLLDRTEQAAQAKALSEQRERIDQFTQGSLQGVYVHAEGQLLYVNAAFAEMLGYGSAEELLAVRDVLKLVAPEEHDRLRGLYDRNRRGDGPPTRYELRGLRADGQGVELETLARVGTWEGRRAVIGTVMDISERKRAERERQASEQKYRDLVEGSMQGMLVQRDQRALLVNDAFASIFGFDSVHQVYALEDLRVLVSDEMRDQMVDYAARRLRGEDVPSHYLARGRRRDGTIVWLDTAVRLVQWDGRPAIQSTVVDISDRVRAERELESSRRLLQAVFDTIPHSVYVKDAELRFHMANRTFCRMLDRSEEEVLGRHLTELDYGDAALRERIEAADRAVIETGQPQEIYDARLTLPSGQSVRRHLIKFPLRDESSRVVGVVGISEDITARVNAEEELRASEQLMRTVIDHLPFLVHVKDRELRYRLANQAFAQVYRMAPEQLLGLRVEDLPNANSNSALFERSDREVIETGRPVELPAMPLTRAGGEERTYHVRKLPLYDGAGGISGVVSIVEDLTERLRAGEELRTSRQLLQTVFNLLPLWVFVKDADRRFQMINRKMAEDYGVAGEVVPGAVVDLGTSITEEEKSVIYDLDRGVLESGELIEVPQVQITLPEQGARLFRTVRMPLRDGDGAVAGIVGIAEDITERHRTEEAMQQAQKLESLGVLAGGVAHDFNNLLVSILGNASLALADVPADSPARASLQNIETAGQRAADLCRQLLAYSGKGSFEITSVSLNTLIEEMTQLLQVSLAKSIQLKYRFDPALPALDVDATEIRQVVMNLVMNAAEAIGNRPGTIEVTTRAVKAERALLQSYIQGEHLPEGRYVLLEVTDTGEGIAPERIGRIFDPFYTTKFEGRGLGLAAVLGIVRGHGGAMRVMSEPGAGSVFSMLLPALR